jgi:hypothetical protein
VTYIGQQPATTFDSGIQDRFTGLTTNTVTLTHDISAETDILVVWNNIVQDSGTYSVGGTGNKTLTLGGTLVSADIVTVYYTNKVMQSVNPTANSVGITQLNVSDGSNGQALTTNGSGTLSFSSAGTTINNNADNRVITGSGTANTLEGEAGLTFEASSTQGSLGLRDSSGTFLLQVEGNESAASVIFTRVDQPLTLGVNNSEKMRIAENGAQLGNLNENLGLSSSSHGLALSGNGYASLRLRRGADNGQAAAFYGSSSNSTPVGDISVTTSSTAYNTSSDYRLKENEVAISDGITRLKTLKPYRFNFKADNDADGKPTQTVDGFFAHEVTAVPEAITGEKDGTDMQGIDQSKLVPLLTSALQEAITKIEALEARVKTLEDA